MPFEILLDSTPMAGNDAGMDDVALRFLERIGYLPTGYDPRTAATEVVESVPYRMLIECFLRQAGRVWSVGELARTLGTSVPTIYRHLDKLAALDVLGQGSLKRDASRKGYFLRYHDLRSAWRFTEVNVELSLQSYRRAVEFIHRSVGMSKAQGEGEPARSVRAEGEFFLRVVNHRFNLEDKWENVAVELLTAVGYLSDIGPMDPRRARRSVPFRLVTDCLLTKPDAGWTIDELSTALDTTKPTVYRYLRRLGQLGVLERSVPAAPPEGDEAGAPKRRFRIRRGSLSKAWNATEWYAKTVMQGYRRAVERIAELAEESVREK
ncbi:MAG: helix-turn-helix domain-containing protein [Thermoplasmatota archaeon]